MKFLDFKKLQKLSFLRVYTYKIGKISLKTPRKLKKASNFQFLVFFNIFGNTCQLKTK